MSSFAPITASRELPAPEGLSGRPLSAASHTEELSALLEPEPSTDIPGALAGLQLELHALVAQRNAAYAERDAAVAERERLRVELNVRNCALDATKTHFMILDMKRPGSPIIYVNRAMAGAHGYEPAELLGKSAMQLIATEHCEQEVRAINQAMRAGGSVRTDVRGRRKDGSSFHAGIFVGPVQDAAGEVTHYVAVGADITARLEEEANRRGLQEQLVNEMRERERMASELRLGHKLEAVGQLAAGIAHEINTPVQYVGDSMYFVQSAARDLEGLLELYRREIATLPASTALSAACERLRQYVLQRDTSFDDVLERGEIAGFAQILMRHRHEPHGLLELRIAGQHDAHRLRPPFAHRAQQPRAVHFRHAHVADDHVERTFLHQLERAHATVDERRFPLVAHRAQPGAQPIEHRLLVVDE